VVDEVVNLDPSQGPVSSSPSAAVLKTLQIGGICNKARRGEDGQNVGQATDVALLNVLAVHGLGDQREVRRHTIPCARPLVLTELLH
jgi:P-type Ca2+ transporter type 2C